MNAGNITVNYGAHKENQNINIKQGMNQNNSFSHFSPNPAKIQQHHRRASKQMFEMEENIKKEIQTLISNKMKMQKEAEQFNQEFQETDLNPEM